MPFSHFFNGTFPHYRAPLFIAIGGFFLLSILPQTAAAARLLVSPSTGTFTVGTTFDVSVFLDTNDKSINAFNVSLKFPPDKLQVVSPSAGNSIINVWTAPPSYDNERGQITFEGGIPGGINVQQGLVSTVTFRATRVGTAVLNFQDTTEVYLHDGKATPALERTQEGVYRLRLPPPAGPVVVSETHADQSSWFSIETAVLEWVGVPETTGYSYMLNDDPSSTPDNISEGDQNRVSYRNLESGTHYFHIRGMREGTWGGVTHFALNVDTEPPAQFPIEVSPRSRTTSQRPVISFRTTDAHSGISHYEYKVVSLQPEDDSSNEFFIEAKEGQHVLDLDLGTYDVLVRAHDNAGNTREEVQRIKVVSPIFALVSGEGVVIGGVVTIPTLWFFGGGLFLLILLAIAAWKIRVWHHGVIARKQQKVLPNKTQKELEELKEYRRRFGNISLIALFFAASLFFGAGTTYAQESQQQQEFAPPYISTVSDNISNEEIFYIGGRTDNPNTDVLIYLQNLQTGETFSNTVASNNENEWFYRHGSFLPSGEYLLWAQAREGDALSPPSPQRTMTVQSTAIQFGSSRLSFEVLYFSAALGLLLLVLVLSIYVIYHGIKGRKHHRALMKEIREAEESVRRGFAVLRRDVQAQLEIIHRLKKSKGLTDEERRKEEQLLKDLEWAEQYIGKEVWDIEEVDHYH